MTSLKRREETTQERRKGFPGDSDDKEPAHSSGYLGSIPRSGRFPQRREWQPTPVFLPEEFHGQRSLVVYSPQGHKELDMTKWLTHTQPYANMGIKPIRVKEFFILWCSLHSLAIPWQKFQALDCVPKGSDLCNYILNPE